MAKAEFIAVSFLIFLLILETISYATTHQELPVFEILKKRWTMIPAMIGYGILFKEYRKNRTVIKDGDDYEQKKETSE